MFYVIQWTWGLLENIIGLAVYLFFHKQTHFKVDKAIATLLPIKGKGNFSLGMFIFIEENQRDITIAHEVGHCYQNCYYGIFKPFIVSIPSVIRFWVFKGNVMTWDRYNKVWFEGQATKIGKKLFQIN